MNTIILSIILLIKNLIMFIIQFWLKILSHILNLKVNDRVRITKYNNVFIKIYTGNWWRQIFITNSVLKTNPWSYYIKDLNWEKLMWSFHEKRIVADYIKNELLSRSK